MRSQLLPGGESRRRAEEQFNRKKTVKPQAEANTAQRAEAEKTARLRALRLAKEAADKDSAARVSAAKAPKTAPHATSSRSGTRRQPLPC
jgi:hypothetical protein